MTKIHHILCGSLHAPPYPKAICHCLLLEDRNGLALIDTGIGFLDGKRPVERIGQALIDSAGFLFHVEETAVRQVEKLGFRTSDVHHAILTHCDPDHAGGLADFPHVQVHVSEEEHTGVAKRRPRYLPVQFAHDPDWCRYPRSTRTWYGLEARPVSIGFDTEVLLIPLFGHTLGHCGIAIGQGTKWVLHVGDAYYLRIETVTDDQPVSLLAAQRADDNALRLASLEHIKRLMRDHAVDIEIFGYHDPAEFPGKP